jgi:hypothetical protein
MEEFIIGETTKIFSKAINRFSKNEKQNPLNTSLILSLSKDEEKNVEYQICFEHQLLRQLSIMEVLGVKIDLKGYSLLVPPQIKKIIENFIADLGSDNVAVSVYLDREDGNQVIYFLFKDGQLVDKDGKPFKITDESEKKSSFELQDVLKLELA